MRKKRTTINEDIRFFKKVKKTNTCWFWIASHNGRGYGQFSSTFTRYAHRYSWISINGIIPNGLCVLHKCDNPSCVNPDHLFLGTHKENMQDKIKKGRDYNQKKTHCKWGHKFTIKNTKYKKCNGARVCNICSVGRRKTSKYKKKSKIYYKNWYLNNKEKIREYQKKYRFLNRAKINKQARIWYNRNKELAND